MRNSTRPAHEAHGTSNASFRTARQISPLLSAAVTGIVAVGMASGLVSYLHRSPILKAHVPGTAAWPQHLVLAALTCGLYGAGWWRHRRTHGRDSGRLPLLAPLSRGAASRLAAATRHITWRSAAVLPPLALTGNCLWRIGEQATRGLDPNFTVSAWGGPTYLGAMACHYLDTGLIIAACAWLLNRILPRPGGA